MTVITDGLFKRVTDLLDSKNYSIEDFKNLMSMQTPHKIEKMVRKKFLLHYLIELSKKFIERPKSLEIRYLLENYESIDVNSKNSKGMSPFMLAISLKLNNLAMIFLHLKMDKINFKIYDSEDRTALILAISHKDLNMVKYLVENSSSEVNRDHSSRLQPLAIAFSAQDIEIFRYLICKGATPNFLMGSSEFFMMLNIVNHANIERIQYIRALLEDPFSKQHINFNKMIVNKKFPEKKINYIQKAVYDGSLELVLLLLKHGCNPNYGITFKNVSPLIMAIETNKNDILKVLLDSNISLEVFDGRNKTLLEGVLQIAMKHNNEFAFELLLKKSVDPNLGFTDLDKNISYTPLYSAVLNKDVKFIETLLKYGANVNLGAFSTEKNDFFETPLFLACSMGELEIIDIILKYDPDLNQGIKQGTMLRSPLYLAALNGNNDVVKKLISKNRDILDYVDNNPLIYELESELSDDECY